MKLLLEVDGNNVQKKTMAVRIVGENEFELLLLRLFDCATPTFRYEGCALTATLNSEQGN